MSIHGHEIMHLIDQSDTPMSRDLLAREVARKFGATATFHTCTGEGMSLWQLIEFLSDRGKVVETDGILRTDVGLMCDHQQ